MSYKEATRCKGCNLAVKLIVGQLPNDSVTVLCSSCWDRIEKLEAERDSFQLEGEGER